MDLSNKVLLSAKVCPEAITVDELRASIIPPGIVIRNSCFACQTLDAVIFPDNMTGVIFQCCNLDNVYIPPGNTVESSCSTLRIQVQGDGKDWIIDKDGNPICPVDDL